MAITRVALAAVLTVGNLRICVCSWRRLPEEFATRTMLPYEQQHRASSLPLNRLSLTDVGRRFQTFIASTGSATDASAARAATAILMRRILRVRLPDQSYFM